jgi:Type II CAAX prenyl endopeptidase Rce1-like
VDADAAPRDALALDRAAVRGPGDRGARRHRRVDHGGALCGDGDLLCGADPHRARVRGSTSVAAGSDRVVAASAAEMRVFAGVGVTAGICEELLYRGFVLWYLSALLPRGWAIVAAVAIFGIGHAYQGVRGVLLTAMVGGIAMAVYLWTGSLIAPIVMHATVDLANGFIAYRSTLVMGWRRRRTTVLPRGDRLIS